MHLFKLNCYYIARTHYMIIVLNFPCTVYNVQQNKGTKVGLLHTTLERSTGGWWAWPVGVARFSSPPKSTSPGVVMCQKCLYLPLLGSAKQEGGHKLLLTKSQKLKSYVYTTISVIMHQLKA